MIQEYCKVSLHMTPLLMIPDLEPSPIPHDPCVMITMCPDQNTCTRSKGAGKGEVDLGDRGTYA